VPVRPGEIIDLPACPTDKAMVLEAYAKAKNRDILDDIAAWAPPRVDVSARHSQVLDDLVLLQQFCKDFICVGKYCLHLSVWQRRHVYLKPEAMTSPAVRPLCNPNPFDIGIVASIAGCDHLLKIDCLDLFHDLRLPRIAHAKSA